MTITPEEQRRDVALTHAIRALGPAARNVDLAMDVADRIAAWLEHGPAPAAPIGPPAGYRAVHTGEHAGYDPARTAVIGRVTP